MSKTFFSIIIPAHNEEGYIEKTLDAIRALDYPKESLEVIVVENGSTDKTSEIARSYEDALIRVLTSGKGVSRAKNTGLEQISEKSDWIILLDADTILKPSFLTDLDTYLKENGQKNLSVGTTTVLPLKSGLRPKLWFAFYNAGHVLTKTSFSIQIVRADLKKDIVLDEDLTFTEDLITIKRALEHGKFFYFKTKDVHTSTRRFDRVGWTKLFFKWNYEAIFMSEQQKRETQYKVIR